ncbi:MAG: methylaspartate mutase, partial [Candidatus Bathyarchaeia archaeon]
ELNFGEIKRIDLPERQEVTAIITPHKGYDLGRGSGHKVEGKVMGGVAGVILDARGRPLQLPEEEKERNETLIKWFNALKLYPEDDLKELL